VVNLNAASERSERNNFALFHSSTEIELSSILWREWIVEYNSILRDSIEVETGDSTSLIYFLLVCKMLLMFYIRIQLVSSAFLSGCGLIIKHTEEQPPTIIICLRKESAMKSV